MEYNALFGCLKKAQRSEMLSRGSHVLEKNVFENEICLEND